MVNLFCDMPHLKSHDHNFSLYIYIRDGDMLRWCYQITVFFYVYINSQHLTHIPDPHCIYLFLWLSAAAHIAGVVVWVSGKCSAQLIGLCSVMVVSRHWLVPACDQADQSKLFWCPSIQKVLEILSKCFIQSVNVWNVSGPWGPFISHMYVLPICTLIYEFISFQLAVVITPTHFLPHYRIICNGNSVYCPE